MTARPPNLAILGATGAVGRALVQALEELELPVGALRLLAGERSAGTEVEFQGEPLRVAATADGALSGHDLVFSALPAGAARALVPAARAAGATVVDLSPAFRLEAGVPLVVPELDRSALAGVQRGGLVASPGAPAVQLSLALAPLRSAGLRRVAVTTFEAASGAGQRGVDALENEMRAMLAFQEPPPPAALPHRIAFNVVPQVGAFRDDGVTEDEALLGAELSRLLGAPSRGVVATSLRVPVFYGHVQTVSVATERRLAAAEARELLRHAPGVKLLDAPREGVYPMPMLAVNDDAVLVGRVREDPTQENGLELVVVGDNLRKGAAVNAVQIARHLLEGPLASR